MITIIPMKFKKNKEYICSECGSITSEDRILTAPHPFRESFSVSGCPDCQEIETLGLCCEESKCKKKATCGTPTNDAYRNLCGEHYRLIND